MSAAPIFFDDTTQKGNVVGKGDMWAQIEQIGKNIQACLAAVGTSRSGIIKTAAFVTDVEAFQKARRHAGALSRSGIADSTTVKVDRLAGPDFLVEMEAIATVN